ncbi:hypothetical protein ACFX2F_034897 [Malus domestica]
MFAKGLAIGQDVVNKVKAFDEKRRLIASAAEKAISFYRKVGLTEKLTVGIFVVNEKVKSVDIKQWQQYFQLRKLNDTGLAIQTSRYVAAWLNGAFGSSNIVVIKSEDEYNSAISKAKDGDEPALFYFTAVWCGPCRFISPVIGELSEQYPHVTTYKIDIDEPAFHLFQDGKKVAEVVGADVALLRDTFGKLYK